MNTVIKIIFILSSVTISAQKCDLEFDYSTSSGWTKVGNNVEIENGKVAFKNLCKDGEQRRIFYTMDEQINVSDMFRIDFDFLPTHLGSSNGNPFTGHAILALTEGNSEPASDCPDIPCTGNPVATNDAISIVYGADARADKEVFLRFQYHDNTIEYFSDQKIRILAMDLEYFVRVEKLCNELWALSIFTDQERLNHVEGSPVYQNIPKTIQNLNTLQHANIARGALKRELEATLDNLCLKFLEIEETTFDLNYTGCENDEYSVVVNGVIFDKDNPTGQERIVRKNGCDSIVSISLEYLKDVTFEVNETHCFQDEFSIFVNGTEYNKDNPSGQEIFDIPNGCDSIVIINLQFAEEEVTVINQTHCSGGGYSIVVNNTEFNEENPSGQENIVRSNKCDSIVKVQLTYINPSTTILQETHCTTSNHSIIVNGQLYNIDNPKGQEIISTEGACDSTIVVDLNYIDCDDTPCLPFIPNIFSPNGDRINDFFSIDFSVCDIVDFEIYIFTRWGERIFYSNQMDFQWDGEYNKQKTEQGVYTYVISFSDKTSISKINMSGTITITQ